MIRGGSAKILVVESDEAVARSLTRLLGGCGAGVSFSFARSAEQWSRFLRTWHAASFDYAFVGARFFGDAAYPMLAEMHRLAPAPSVAIVADWITPAFAERAFARGAMPMAMPVNEQMARELLELLEFRRGKSAALSHPRVPVSLGEVTLRARELETPDGKHHLRRAEQAILEYLHEQAERIVSPEEIAVEVLNRCDSGSTRSVYTHVSNLRRALGKYAPIIETVTSATGTRTGYRLVLSAARPTPKI